MRKSISEWAKYSKYEPNKKSFVLKIGGSNIDWEMQSKNDKLMKFIYDWDKEGFLSSLYIKQLATQLLSSQKLTLLDIVSGTREEQMEEAKKLWQIVTSEEYTNSMSEFISSIQMVAAKMSSQQLLGSNGDLIEEAVLDNIGFLVEDISKLRVETYCQDSSIISINKVYSGIRVFRTLSQCLLTIQSSEDALYLCYIDNYGSIDGWFGYFIKSGNNIISINERLREAYKGQHANSRNGRFTDKKAFNLFPYDIINFSDQTDYKGYSTHSTARNEETPITETENYISIITMMYLIYNRFNGAHNDYTKVYVDSLLKANIGEILRLQEASTNLPVITNNNLLLIQQESPIEEITTEQIVSNALGEELSRGKDREYFETGFFVDDCSSLVSKYGKGFKLSRELMKVPLIGSNEGGSELVGTAKQIQLWSYYDGRKQLADYIRSNIRKEYDEFGGDEAAVKWFNSQCAKNINKLLDLVIDKEISGTKYGSVYSVPVGSDFRILKEQLSYGEFNPDIKLSNDTNNLLFEVTFLSTNAFNTIFGEENVPSILSEYKYIRQHSGNSILDATDEVARIYMPYEPHGSSGYGVRFAINFSMSKKYFRQAVRGRIKRGTI